MRKRMKVCFVLFGMFLCVNGFNLYAASSMEEANNKEKVVDPYYDIEETVNQMFEGMNPDDKVLRDEQGGWLYGECTEVDAYDPSIVLGYYNSETDPNSVTVEEAKQIVIKEFYQEYSN